MNETCAYVFIDNNKTKFPCQHSTYGGQEFCVFHFKDIHDKRSDFDNAINKLIAIRPKEPLDLKGFIFPRFISKRQVFNCAVDARHAQFLDTLNFEGSVFEEDADFLGAFFLHEAIFQGVKFLRKHYLWAASLRTEQYLSAVLLRARQCSTAANFPGLQLLKIEHFKTKPFFRRIRSSRMLISEIVALTGLLILPARIFTRDSILPMPNSLMR